VKYETRGTAVVSSINNLAVLVAEMEDFEAAERLQRESVEILLRDRGEDDTWTLTAVLNLASFLYMRGEAAEAEAWFELAERILGRARVPETADTIDARISILKLRYEQSRFPEAEAIARKALELAERVVPADVRLRSKITLWLGVVLFAEERYAEAAPWFESAWLADRESLGANAEESERAAKWLRVTFERLGKPDEYELVVQRVERSTAAGGR
jgi:tetratricopeptide (TPR) repeat protein